ncbi:BolA/IbaG family iron-sulfur metabolism protein [Cardiobacteriales bacterium ML27]|uniref:BolA/IbaG family iron-sulfur metabolism protein n=2 Tax=Ostreibacterium oceani TaxID=2654998 RepID=A0A6N7EVM2_9GAMM|nr:BolA/IbaG family iron-sulfur metabolism protein [Ostreibacterium oceani]
MTTRLTTAFTPTQLDIIDESHLHIGHAGAQSGKGHYALTITSEAFAGKSRLQCHRMIYQALGELMQDNIHALSIKINT